MVVAAEGRELAEILRRIPNVKTVSGLNVQFARKAEWRGGTWLFLANGPGPRLAGAAWEEAAKLLKVDRMISTGFCGALDPALQIGDIVVSGPEIRSSLPFRSGSIASRDRVASTAAEKASLRQSTAAIVTEMEAQAGEERAAAWGVPFQWVKAVSDTSDEDFPLDFNQLRDREGRFSLIRIALRALSRPLTHVPALLRLDNHCRVASGRLGEFFDDCKFD